MEAVDQTILQNTVRFQFEDGAPPDTRLWILKLLKKLTSPETIQAVFRSDDGRWHVTLQDQDCVSRVTEADLSGLERRVYIERCDRRTLRCRIQWLPVWIQLTAVINFLKQFGKVISCDRETETAEGITFANGAIKVVMEITEENYSAFPHIDTIAGRKCLFSVAGRPPLCLKCREPGHTRKECPQRKTDKDAPAKKDAPVKKNTIADTSTKRDKPAPQEPVTKKSTPQVDRMTITLNEKLKELYVEKFDALGTCFSAYKAETSELIWTKKKSEHSKFLQRLFPDISITVKYV